MFQISKVNKHKSSYFYLQIEESNSSAKNFVCIRICEMCPPSQSKISK